MEEEHEVGRGEVHSHLGAGPTGGGAGGARRESKRAGAAGESERDDFPGSGALEWVRENPLPALGLAFVTGYLLAGSGDTGGGRFGRVKQQLRGALLGGLGAVIAQEAERFLGDDAAEGLLGSLLGRDADERGGSRGGRGGGRG